jgi:hypothetical protein
MRSYTREAIPGQFEAGAHLGSMTSLQKTGKGQIWQFLSKADYFYQVIENKQHNRTEQRSQSQEVL